MIHTGTLPLVLQDSDVVNLFSLISNCCEFMNILSLDLYFLSVTHVVSSVNKEGYCGRTIKNLRALVDGKWIINFECKAYLREMVSITPFTF